MPTYEYECTKCGKVFELFQRITEPPRRKLRSTDPKPCRCNAPVSRRISTGGGLIFKGSGFYLTDYRNESYKKAAAADSGASEAKASDTKATDAKSTDSKTETKTGTEPKASTAGEKAGKKKRKTKTE